MRLSGADQFVALGAEEAREKQDTVIVEARHQDRKQVQ
jgi:hypothetical protein